MNKDCKAIQKLVFRDPTRMEGFKKHGENCSDCSCFFENVTRVMQKTSLIKAPQELSESAFNGIAQRSPQDAFRILKKKKKRRKYFVTCTFAILTLIIIYMSTPLFFRSRKAMNESPGNMPVDDLKDDGSATCVSHDHSDVLKDVLKAQRDRHLATPPNPRAPRTSSPESESDFDKSAQIPPKRKKEESVYFPSKQEKESGASQIREYMTEAAEKPVLDSKSSSVGVNIERDFTERLPVQRRHYA